MSDTKTESSESLEVRKNYAYLDVDVLDGLLAKNSPNAAVLQFMRQYGADIGRPDRLPEPHAFGLGVRLVMEELQELEKELNSAALVYRYAAEDHRRLWDEWVLRLFKEMSDVQYVLHYLAIVLGYDLDGFFNRVHWSNMTKTADPDGDKVQKGPNYVAPKLREEMHAQAGDFYYFGDGPGAWSKTYREMVSDYVQFDASSGSVWSAGGNHIGESNETPAHEQDSRVKAVLDSQRQAAGEQRQSLFQRSIISLQDFFARLFRG